MTMSTAQNYDFASGNATDEAKDQPPLTTSDSVDNAGGSGPGGILGAATDAVGNLSHAVIGASSVVKQGADAVVNAGKGVLEMGGSVISGLKRGFSKTSESGND